MASQAAAEAVHTLSAPKPEPQLFQGYVDERSTHHIAGWLRNLNDAAARIPFEVVLRDAGQERVLAAGIADSFSALLVQVGVGDGGYAFRVDFAAPLTEAERDHVIVRPAGSRHQLELAPALRTSPPVQATSAFQGYIDELSTAHIAGWVRDLNDPDARVSIEIVLPHEGAERILATLRADQFNEIVRAVGVGDGTYAFFHLFSPVLTEAERAALFVRPVGSAHRLEIAPAVKTAFEPIHHIAMDIVNNCNLRCPFCVFDYAHTNRTEFMTDATFDAALRLIPYVTDGNFWLSCLHEATLHPRLVEFIQRVPAQYRKKLFFTTNLAKRMPDSYFQALADSGMSHINISVESLDPVVYERMRKGARFGIFADNWRRLLEIFAAHPAPPRIRYNMMAYRSNLFEIPQFLDVLLREKSGWQIEIRNTFDEPHIPAQFRDFEFLTTAEWAWLDTQLKRFSPDEVILLLPPDGIGYDRYAPQPPPPPPPSSPTSPAAAAAPLTDGAVHVIAEGPASRPFNLRIAWDGTLNVYSELPRSPGQPPTHANYLFSNINDLADPMATLFSL